MKLAVAALLAALAPVAQAQVTIKLGTLAPQGSTWHDILKDLAQRWEQASNGQVKLRIYAGGAQGSEGDMVRKMGIGQLQAAAISNVGMHDVIPDPQVMSVPFLFDDPAQMECAFAKLRGQFEAARSTGLSGAQTMAWVIVPQATRNVMPDLISNTLEVVKLTSIASVVALPELLYAARQAQSVTYNATPIIAAGIIYLVCLWPLVRLLSRFEHRQIALH